MYIGMILLCREGRFFFNTEFIMQILKNLYTFVKPEKINNITFGRILNNSIMASNVFWGLFRYYAILKC